VGRARTSVGDVPEFALPVKLDEVREEVLLYQVRMELSDSIDFSAPNDCEIGHADLLWEALCRMALMSLIVDNTEDYWIEPSISDKRSSLSRSPGNFFSTAGDE
jgi:hypothetical protein